MGGKVPLYSKRFENFPSIPCFLLGTAETARIIHVVPLLATPPESSEEAWTIEHAGTFIAMLPGCISLLGTYTPF